MKSFCVYHTMAIKSNRKIKNLIEDGLNVEGEVSRQHLAIILNGGAIIIRSQRKVLISFIKLMAPGTEPRLYTVERI